MFKLNSDSSCLPLVPDVPPILAKEKDQEPSQTSDDLLTVPPKQDKIIWAWKVRIPFILSVLNSFYLNSRNST